MKIAITGAKGLVGSEFVRQLLSQHEVNALAHEQLDITDAGAVNRLCSIERPELIINCAVVGVDASEDDPLLGHQVNVDGAENLARAAQAVDAELVYLSTNYVFDGRRAADSPYTIEDQPHPVNIYGYTKLAGERAVIASNRRSFIVRTAWVFGPGKESFLSNLPRSLRAGKNVRAISDAYSSTTYVSDLVARVIEIVAKGRYATYHVVNSGVCSFADFAFEVARQLEISPARAAELIETVALSDFEFAAPRPRYAGMACKVSAALGLPPLRDWPTAVADYLHQDNSKS